MRSSLFHILYVSYRFVCISVWSSCMWGPYDRETVTISDTTGQGQTFEHLRPPTSINMSSFPSLQWGMCVFVQRLVQNSVIWTDQFAQNNHKTWHVERSPFFNCLQTQGSFTCFTTHCKISWNALTCIFHILSKISSFFSTALDHWVTRMLPQSKF